MELHRQVDRPARGGKQDTPKYQKLCQKAELKREKAKVKYCDLAYEMLERIEQAYARHQAGNRDCEDLEEIPIDTVDFSSNDSMTRRSYTGTISAMHRSRRTLASSTTGCISSRWLATGFHLHDVEFPARDHRPPGRGMIDYEGLKHIVKPEHIKVFELVQASSRTPRGRVSPT